ncbi:MAG: hypothetical protein AAF684_04335, partial [Pseudomonadota bacterium]
IDQGVQAVGFNENLAGEPTETVAGPGAGARRSREGMIGGPSASPRGAKPSDAGVKAEVIQHQSQLKDYADAWANTDDGDAPPLRPDDLAPLTPSADQPRAAKDGPRLVTDAPREKKPAAPEKKAQGTEMQW